MSNSVRAGLVAQFHSGAHADMRIRFHLERTPEQQQQQQQEKQQDADGAAGRAVATILRFVGEPLPAHIVILTLGSTLLQAKLSNPCWQGGAAARVSKGAQTEDQGGGSSDESQLAKRRRTDSTPLKSAELSIPMDDGQAPAVCALPEVLVPLSSEAEVPFARQAIEFIYTGSLSAGLGFEALLRVRQQACYLGVKDCPQACDQAMLAWLQAGEQEVQLQGQQQQQQQQQGQDGAGPSTGIDLTPRVLQAYACHALFPEPGTDGDPASFDAVRSALAKQLVSHFGDAVAALSRPDLYRQLLQLPAVAMRELLAADDFGTDSEDSVFLMLACWLDAHKGEEGKEEGVPAATRAELCGLVRLHRLRPLYLNFVLHAYEPFSVASRVELGCLLRFVGAGEQERTLLLDVDPQRRLCPWYCSPARRQVVPEEGRTVEWSISREQLEQGLREMVEGKLVGSKKMVYVDASFGASGAAVGGSGAITILADGGLWGVQLELDPANSTMAGMFVVLTLPRPLGEVQGVAGLTHVRVTVHRWAEGERKASWTRKFTAGDVVATTVVPTSVQGAGGFGWPTALELPPVAASAAGGEGAGAGGVAAEVAAQLARWSGWLHEGKVTGSATFPRM